MKLILVLLILLLIVAVAGTYGLDYLKKNGTLFEPTKKVTIGTYVFKVLVADTDTKKQVGLSEKTSLSDDSGMIFPFTTTGYYSFWMKNMKIPIDMLFIHDNKLVTVQKNVQPPKSADENLPIYTSDEPADTILEIKAGLSEKYGFKKGDGVKVQ